MWSNKEQKEYKVVRIECIYILNRTQKTKPNNNMFSKNIKYIDNPKILTNATGPFYI